MIIKTEQLTYNYLTFKKPTLNPEPFSMHCHTTYELIFFEKGEANYIIDENKYKLHKNDLIFIRPYKYHYIEFTKDTEYSRINIAFSDKIVNKEVLSAISNDIEIINCPQNSILENLFKRMTYYATKLNTDSFEEIITSMLTEILYNIMLTDVDMVTKSRVRLLGGGCSNLGANASLLRRAKIGLLTSESIEALLKCGALRLVSLVGTTFFDELVKGWHDFPPSSNILFVILTLNGV